LNVRDIWRVVLKELTIGFILGITYGLLVGILAEVRYNAHALAVAVGLAVVSSMSIAALVGSLVPMAFAKVQIDPAVATGPFVTTAIDIISVFLYFIIATSLIGL
jgi:magnesium transporter